MGKEPATIGPTSGGWIWPLAVGLAAAIGVALAADEALRNSATYDEVTYLRVAARWWRTGDQEAISRLGSPLTFWKLQQAPVLWAIDRAGFGRVIDDPIAHQAVLLPLVRLGSLWIWLVALLMTAGWARSLYGPRAMAMAAGLFAVGPNLLAHGALATMELPLLAATTAMFLLFWRFLRTGRSAFFWATAVVGGLAMSCKFTTVLVPPILALAWWVDLRRSGGGLADSTRRVVAGMAGFLALMVLANLAATGFATLPLSPRTGAHPALDGRFGTGMGRLVSWVVETPWPQDWVGFATQVRHQRSGGPSYLLGERRMTGWWYYYAVALAVKVPLAFWLLLATRAVLGRRLAAPVRDGLIPIVLMSFLLATVLGSSRNYGVRYLLPLAPPAIVWISALAEGSRRVRGLALAALAAQAMAVVWVHPHELSYFNALAGGPRGGRLILADSNLDWGQGAKALARLQRERPEFRDLTLYYFGNTDPGYYGVVGRRHIIDAGQTHPGLPESLDAETAFVAVSTSLRWGPWGPPDYFRAFEGVEPVATLDDQTVTIYRSADLPGARQAARLPGRHPANPTFDRSPARR